MNRLMTAAALFAALLSACGGARSRSTNAGELSPLDELRAQAADDADNVELQRQLAEAELLWPGGDMDAAVRGLDASLQQRPTDTSLLLMRALVHDFHGEHSAALDVAIRVVEVAKELPTDEAAHHAEYALTMMVAQWGGTPRYEERVRPLLDSLLANPGALGEPAVRWAASLRRQLAWRRGDHAAGRAAAARGGCLVEGWRAVGPFGPLPMSTYDDEQPALGLGPLAERYDLGVGRGEDAVFEVESQGCALRFAGGEVSGAGTTIAETFVEVESAGRHVFVVGTGSAFKLYVDGELVHALDRRQGLYARRIHIPVELSAGRHEVELKLTARGAARAEVILDWPGRLGQSYEPSRGASLDGEPNGSFERVLRTLILLSRSDNVGAREAFGPIASFELPPLALEVYRRVIRADPFITAERTGELETRLIAQIAEQDTAAVYAALASAQSEQGTVEQAQRIRAVAERWPDVLGAQLALTNVLRQQDQLTDAEEVLGRLRERFPDECGLVAQLRELYRSQQRVAEANALVESIIACDATSAERYRLFVRQRRWEQAEAEVARLEPLFEDPDELRTLRLELAIATGNTEAAETIRRTIDAESERPTPSQTLRAVDDALAAGRRGEAVRILDAAFESQPEEMASLRPLRRDLTGRDDLEPYRQDGLEIIERYESGDVQHPDATEVLVFDYMVTRVYPDGSARNLVHQIYKVQSEEAIERLGQLSLGGQILTLRSIKPDGRQLEPESIRGLDTIPMSELGIGDYVEYEYVTGGAPLYNGGFRSPGWSFDSSQHPFAFSQMVAVVPSDVEVTVEALGGTPEASVRQDGDLKIMTWTMEHVPSRPPEPNAVPVPPYRPTLRFGIDADWESFFPPLREALLGRDPVDPAAMRLVRRLVGEAQSPQDIAARLHAWVSENIEPAQGLTAVAPLMVAAERGDRSRVLRYLLTLAGLDARLLVVRQFGTMEPGPLATGGIYEGLLLQVVPEGGEPFIVWADGRHAPYDYIPPGLRGQSGVVVLGNETMSRVTIPDVGAGADVLSVQVDMRFEGEDALLEVEQQFFGMGALAWRREIERLPPAELERLLSEGFVPRVLPGADVIALEVDGAEDVRQPFILRYRARIPNFGRRGPGGSILVPPLFPTNLAAQQASLPSRTTSMGVPAFAQDVRVVIHGGQASQPPVAVERGNIRYARRVVQEGADIVIERSIRVQNAVIPAGDYADYAQMVRELSQIDMVETPVTR